VFTDDKADTGSYLFSSSKPKSHRIFRFFSFLQQIWMIRI
jgi:hypothetical protein